MAKKPPQRQSFFKKAYHEPWAWVGASYLLELVHARSYVMNPQFWGEEGKVFFQQAYEEGLAPLFRTCMGYIHVYPRLVSFVATLLPIRVAPHIAILGALVGQLSLFLTLWSPRLRMPHWAKVLFSLAVVMVPQGGEVIASLTNIQWFLGLALILFFLRDPPQSRTELLKDLLLLGFLGTTGPFLVLFTVPALAVRVASRVRPQRLELARWAAVVILASANFCTWDLSARSTVPPVANSDWNAWAAAFGQAVLPFYTSLSSPRLLAGISSGWLALALGLFAATAWLAFPSREELRNPVRWMILLTGCLPWAAGIWECRQSPQLPYPYANGQRYFFVMYVAIAWLLALTATLQKAPRFQRRMATVALASSAFFSLCNFGSVMRHADYDYAAQAQEFERTGELEFKQPPDWTYRLQRSRYWRTRG